MGLVKIFALPTHLRIGSERMAKIIREGEFDVLFLDLSRSLNELINALAEGAPYEIFLKRIKELALVPEPIGSWEYEMKPILLAVKGILNRKPVLKLWCYKEPGFDRFSVEVAENLAKLVLRASLSKKIDVDEWRVVITRLLEASADALNQEAEYITQKSSGKKTCICISGINGRALRDCLAAYGLETSLTYVILPYHFTPIEILTREIEKELRGSILDDERLRQIIDCHITFVREYVLLSPNYDDAYFRWVKDTASWIKCRFHEAIARNEIRPFET